MSISPELENQLIEAKIAEIKETKSHGFSMFRTGDTEVDGALEGGSMGIRSTAEDKVIIYHAETHEPREILVNMLAKTLRQRLPDGRLAFSLTPLGDFRYGNVPCFLNPASPYRDEADEAGLGGLVCSATKLASEYDANQHARHRHRREYAVWQEYRERRDREEERELRRAEVVAMREMAKSATGKAG